MVSYKKTHLEGGWGTLERGIHAGGDVMKRIGYLTGVTAGKCAVTLGYEMPKGVVHGIFRRRAKNTLEA